MSRITEKQLAFQIGLVYNEYSNLPSYASGGNHYIVTNDVSDFSGIGFENSPKETIVEFNYTGATQMQDLNPGNFGCSRIFGTKRLTNGKYYIVSCINARLRISEDF